MAPDGSGGGGAIVARRARPKHWSQGDPFGRWARWYGRHSEKKKAWAREWMRKKRAEAKAMALSGKLVA